MTNTDKREETSLNWFEKETKPNKFKFFTYKPNKKRFKVRTKRKHTNIYITQGYWTKSDHAKFIKGLYLYGCDWKKLQVHVKNRSYKQMRSNAQKFYNRLKTFKDEELGIDFTTPNVKNLNDIIKIIKEKELISENYGKLLFIISEKLSFGKKPLRTSKINEGNTLNNCDC